MRAAHLRMNERKHWSENRTPPTGSVQTRTHTPYATLEYWKTQLERGTQVL